MGGKDPKDLKDLKDPKDLQDLKDLQDPKDLQDLKEGKGNQNLKKFLMVFSIKTHYGPHEGLLQQRCTK